jgi:hypothetical protein
MKYGKVICTAGILGLLMAAGVLMLFTSDKTFSENENRVLTGKPVLKAESLLDGSFQTQLDSFLSDQFPGRDIWMTAGTEMKLLTGRRDIGNTYIGKDHYYFEKVTDSDLDMDRYVKNLHRIEQLAETNTDVPISVMLVPSSGVVLSEKLPAHAQLYNAEKMLQTAAKELPECTLADPTDALKSTSENSCYYHTDHHWTTTGAYRAYQTLMGKNAQYAFSEKDFSEVSDTFLGTLYSRTLDPGAVPDKICLAPVSERLEVTCDGVRGSVYVDSALKEKDKYKVFFGGNYGKVEITGGTGKGTLLVLKDSFANSLVPFLTADYEKIIMIDLRYYSGSVNELLGQGKIDRVLVLYELNNFAADTNLVKLVL